MLVKNKDASFLTKSLQARTVFANQIVAQQKFEQGCGRFPQLDSGSGGTLEFSNKILLSEGEVLTSPTFKASLLAGNTCPVPAAAPTGPTDQIAASLTTSLAAYTAASTNDWIEITSAEYTALQTNVASTVKCGVSDSILTTAANTSLALVPIFIAPAVDGTNSLSIAANSYIYAVAFMYYVNGTTGMRIFANTNTAATNGYVQVGNALPATTGNTVTVQYYVRKGAATTNGATAGRLAIYDSAASSGLVTKGGVGVSSDYNNGLGGVPPTSSTSLNSSIASAVSLQGLTTTSKQW
jgi:hypothetical protein